MKDETLEALRTRIVKRLREKDALPRGHDVVLIPYGEGGVRCCVVAARGASRSIQVRAVHANQLRGSLRDSVNGLVGGLLAQKVDDGARRE